MKQYGLFDATLLINNWIAGGADLVDAILDSKSVNVTTRQVIDEIREANLPSSVDKGGLLSFLNSNKNLDIIEYEDSATTAASGSTETFESHSH